MKQFASEEIVYNAMVILSQLLDCVKMANRITNFFTI